MNVGSTYHWLVFAHLLGIFGFLLAHGSAAGIAFKLRGERETARVRALLDLSRSTSMAGTVSILVLLTSGIALGFMSNFWRQGWLWTSLGLFVLMGVGMMMLGTRLFQRLRLLVTAGEVATSTSHLATQKQLEAMLATIQPVLLTIVGGGGLAIILWLMLFKPF